MPRHHMTADGPVPFTPGEEDERDAEEAAWQAMRDIETHNSLLRAGIEAIEGPTGFTRRQREFLIANSPSDPLKVALTTIDDVIASKRAAITNP